MESIKEFIVGRKAENWQREENSTITMFSSSFQSFWERLIKPEKSQTYLVYRRINCSAVSTSALFKGTKLSTNPSFTVHPDNKTRLNFHYTAQQSQQLIQQTQTLFAGANVSVINIQLLVLPCSGESKRSPTNSLKRRRHFLASSHEEDL